MIIDYFVLAIITFISPFIISRYFELNDYKGYSAGLFCCLSIIGAVFCLSLALFLIFIIFAAIAGNDSIIVIFIFIMIFVFCIGIIILTYIFNFYFMKNIINETKNAYIFMYISGFYLISGISMFFSSFQEKRIEIKEPKIPEYINNFLGHPIVKYYDYCFAAVQFGICVCIFFNWKKSNKSLFFISLGMYLGIIIIPAIAIIFDSIIIFVVVFLFPLFSLIFGIYLYIKYEKEDNTTQTGHTITDGLV